MTSPLTDDEIARYARQLILPEIGDAGQDVLAASRLLIIGAGGLGTPALIMAATAGFGAITLMDDDLIDATNLNRQFLYRPEQIGLHKAPIAAAYATAQNPHITITALTERFDEAQFDKAQADALFAAHDIIIDASDNPQTRRLANRLALRTSRPLIFVSAIRFEGQLAVFAPHLSPNPDASACYECLFPQAGQEADIPNCATIGIAGPITTIMGALATLEAMKLQLAQKGLSLKGRGQTLLDQLLLFDGLYYQNDLIKTKRDISCPACSTS